MHCGLITDLNLSRQMPSIGEAQGLELAVAYDSLTSEVQCANLSVPCVLTSFLTAKGVKKLNLILLCPSPKECRPRNVCVEPQIRDESR